MSNEEKARLKLYIDARINLIKKRAVNPDNGTVLMIEEAELERLEQDLLSFVNGEFVAVTQDIRYDGFNGIK